MAAAMAFFEKNFVKRILYMMGICWTGAVRV